MRFILLSIVIITNKIVTAIKTGNGNVSTLSGMAKGPNNAGIPMTANALKILEPVILPIAISTFPLRAEDTATEISGREVPIATALNAIISVPIDRSHRNCYNSFHHIFGPKKNKNRTSQY